jgi:mRNA-degrading endonuclease RelE of RelBE toxin-antitoxin system
MRVILSPRAVGEYEALPKAAARRVTTALERLAADPTGRNPNVKALVGRKPWRRLRVGEYRILFLFRSSGNRKALWVGRIIDRKELERAVRSLPD